MKVGILAIQGNFAAHANCLKKLGVAFDYVKTTQQLKTCDGLIIPGGESTTMLNFITTNGLFESIKIMQEQGKPIFGTCAGAILLAKKVFNPEQQCLGLIDMVVERNAYGRQFDSKIKHCATTIADKPQEMIFIRAPKIIATDKNVKILAQCHGEIVCVQQGNCIAATFHPELSDEILWHQYFLTL